jgi:hypothetical protein
MAYPAVSAPYGLVPINLIGGQPFAGSTRHFSIAPAYATAIYNGDVVKMAAGGGTIEKDIGTATATPVGVFLGCTYTDPVYGKVFRQSYPVLGASITDIFAYVCDDPDALFKVAVVSGTTVIGGVARTAIGRNTSLVQNAGVPANGNSRVAASQTVAGTATLPLRVIDVVAETVNAAGLYTEVIVKWNATMHQYNTAAGV